MIIKCKVNKKDFISLDSHADNNFILKFALFSFVLSGIAYALGAISVLETLEWSETKWFEIIAINTIIVLILLSIGVSIFLKVLFILKSLWTFKKLGGESQIFTITLKNNTIENMIGPIYVVAYSKIRKITFSPSAFYIHVNNWWSFNYSAVPFSAFSDENELKNFFGIIASKKLGQEENVSLKNKALEEDKV